TGVALMSAPLIGKCVELFRDMLSAPRRIAILTNAADPLFAKLVLEQVDLARRIGIDIQPITVRGPDEELDAAFAAMTSGRADAAVIQGSFPPSVWLTSHLSTVCQPPRQREALRMPAALCHMVRTVPPSFGTAQGSCKGYCRAGNRTTYP